MGCSLRPVFVKPQKRLRLGSRRRPVYAVVFDLDGTLTRPYLDFGQLRQQLGISDGDILKGVTGLPPVEQGQALRK